MLQTEKALVNPIFILRNAFLIVIFSTEKLLISH